METASGQEAKRPGEQENLSNGRMEGGLFM